MKKMEKKINSKEKKNQELKKDGPQAMRMLQSFTVCVLFQK